MANEISINASLQVSSNGATAAGTGAISNTLSGNVFLSKIVPLASTTKEALVFDEGADVGGFLFLKNLHATSTMVISLTTSTADVTNTVATLLPGEFVLFKPASGATVSATPTAGGDLLMVYSEL